MPSTAAMGWVSSRALAVQSTFLNRKGTQAQEREPLLQSIGSRVIAKTDCADEIVTGGRPWMRKDGGESVCADLSQKLLGTQDVFREEDLRKWACAASCNARRWDPKAYLFIKPLQDAPTNQGVVDLMQALNDGKMSVAVKRMPNTWVCGGPGHFDRCNPDSAERPWNDAGITKYLNHIDFPFACTLHGIFRDHATTYVVSSFAAEGDLFSWIERADCTGPQYEAQMKPLVLQIFLAIQWLHELGIGHRDLSVENILLDQDGSVVKIIDFGLATATRACGANEARGKKAYRAPEMYFGGYDAFAADNFALGVVLFATAAQDYPWMSTEPTCCSHYGYMRRKGLRAFLKAKRSRIDPGTRLFKMISPGLVDVIEGFLEVDPDARLNVGETCWTTQGPTSVWVMPWVQQKGLPTIVAHV